MCVCVCVCVCVCWCVCLQVCVCVCVCVCVYDGILNASMKGLLIADQLAAIYLIIDECVWFLEQTER